MRFGKYVESVGFDSLRNQCADKQAEQVKTDNQQSEMIAQLEERIAVLEEYVFKAQTNEMVDAIGAMNSGESMNVSFPSDVVLKEKALSIKADTNVTIDLNNTSIKAEKPSVDVILIEDNATLIINGDGLVESANGGDGYPIIANGKLIINGGSFKSGYDADNQANACVYARGNGQVEIYGGRFESFDGTFVLNIKDADRATASIKAMGGEYVNFNPSDNASEGANTNFVPSGYKVESYQEGENTIYKVVEE